MTHLFLLNNFLFGIKNIIGIHLALKLTNNIGQIKWSWQEGIFIPPHQKKRKEEKELSYI